MTIAGMATSDSEVLLLVRHAGIDRGEVADILQRRWPGAIVGDVGTLAPSWEMPVENAVELARARRGVEPLRIVVLAQRASFDEQGVDGSPTPGLEPMPVLV